MIRNTWHQDNQVKPLLKFEELTAEGKGSAWVDHVNGNRHITWVCMDKNTVNLYMDYGNGWHRKDEGSKTPNKDAYLSAKLIKTNSVDNRTGVILKVFHSQMLAHSTCPFGWKFHSHVTYTKSWEDVSSLLSSDKDHWRWANQSWIKAKNMDQAVPSHKNMTFDLSGNLISKPSQKDWAWADKWSQVRKERQNGLQRARYHDKKAQERLLESTSEIDDVFKLFNVSQRRDVIAKFGMNNILSQLDSTVVDKETIDGRDYELVIVNIPESGEAAGFRMGTYLRMINPSTGEIHFEGVPNVKDDNMDNDNWDVRSGRRMIDATVRCALAWRDGETGEGNFPDDYTNELETKKGYEYIEPKVLS